MSKNYTIFIDGVKKVIDQKKILLVGCGHANLQVLHSLGKIKDKLNLDITVLNDVAKVPYSGMLPGYVMNNYQLRDIEFDLDEISKRYGVHFCHDTVKEIDFKKKEIQTLSGKSLNYDYCSINLGSVPTPIHRGQISCNITYIKPISDFLVKINEIKKNIHPPEKIVIIGGGVAGFEISIASSEAFKEASITIIAGIQVFFSNQSKSARKIASNVLKQRNIKILEGISAEVQNDTVFLSNGEIIKPDLCIVAVSASPPKLALKSFLNVNEYLQVEGFPEVFAAGDCINFRKRPLPKAGVFAVKEGKVLSENIRRVLTLESLKKYIPQKRYLALMMSGKDEVILSWGSFALKSKFLWPLKNYIDNRFMKKFR